MFWETQTPEETGKLSDLVEQPEPNLDDILDHVHCFQELRMNVLPVIT